MAHLGFILIVIGSHLAVVSLSTITVTEKSAAKENEETEFSKEPYIFPEIHDGNALLPTLDLVLSQKRYHEEMARIYQKMLRKNANALSLKQMDAMIFNTGIMIDSTLESLHEYKTGGAPDEDVKKQPWCLAASNSVLNSWRTLIQLCDDMRNEGIDREIDAFTKVVNSAIGEMEVYEKYADVIYDEITATTLAEDDSGSNDVGSIPDMIE